MWSYFFCNKIRFLLSTLNNFSLLDVADPHKRRITGCLWYIDKEAVYLKIESVMLTKTFHVYHTTPYLQKDSWSNLVCKLLRKLKRWTIAPTAIIMFVRYAQHQAYYIHFTSVIIIIPLSHNFISNRIFHVSVTVYSKQCSYFNLKICFISFRFVAILKVNWMWILHEME
jgi:hypothetical protein